MTNLVIAYSQQYNNKCKMGDTEHAHMYEIAKILFDILKRDKRFNVYLIPEQNTGNDLQNLRNSVRLSNQFIANNGRAGYHIELHSDAGAYAKGCSGLYYTDGGKKFIEPITKELIDLTPWNDVGVRQRRDLLALRGTLATAGLIEISFHDNQEEAEWIHKEMNAIAIRIANGIYKALNGEVK